MKIEATLGRGDLTSAQALIDDLVNLLGDIAHAAAHSAPRRVIALNYLVSGQLDRARHFLTDAVTALPNQDREVGPRR
jgi:hypothetical protein